MTCSHFVALLTVALFSVSSGEINEECKDVDKQNTQIVNFYGCCDFMSKIEKLERNKDEQEAYTICKEEWKKNNFTAENLPLASEGHDCVMECIMKRLGAMGQDYKLNREKVYEMFLRGFPEEIQEAGKLAIDKCLIKNFSKKYCASGISGLLMCFPEELVMNCPAEIWSSNESCAPAKEALKKCPSYHMMLEKE